MTKEEQVVELIAGYANGFITDDECMDMCDLVMNEITVITEREVIEEEMLEQMIAEWEEQEWGRLEMGIPQGIY